MKSSTLLFFGVLLNLFALVVPLTAADHCVPPPAGLVDWWPFDETAVPGGTIATDISGSANNASLPYLGPVPVPGMVSNALRFDGLDDFVVIPNHPEINFFGACGQAGVEDFTIDLWVRPEREQATMVLLDKRDITTNASGACVRGYALGLQGGRVVFQMGDGSGSPCHTSYVATTPLSANVWHLIAVSVRRCQAAGGGFIYVDGKIDGTFAPRTGAIDNQANLILGKNVQTSTFYLGAMDELEFFKRALTKPELDAIFLAGSAGKCKTADCIQMNCPTELVINTSSNCAPANFSVTATNPCCSKLLVSCFPASGSLFPLGTTMVTCTASDVCGSRRVCSFPVTVNQVPAACLPPAIVAQPQTGAIALGGSGTLSVVATGTPVLTYQWQHAGVNIPGANVATLPIANAQRSDAGAYTVVVANSCGAVTSLVAQVLIGQPQAPDAELSVAASSAVRIGSNYTYNITVRNIGNISASSLVLTGHWSGAAAGFVSGPAGCVFNVTPGLITMSCNVGSLAVGSATNYAIQFSALTEGNVSFGAAVGGDPLEGNMANNNATATTGFGHPPVIVLQPLDAFSTPGGVASFSLMATGTASIAYHWVHSGLPAGANSPTLDFPDVHSSDGGTYVCVASNAWGSEASAPATLTLAYPATPVASIATGGQLRFVGSSGTDDIEVRLAAGNPTLLEIDNLATTGPADFVFDTTLFTTAVIDLGDQNNKLIFNDVNGPVSGLPVSFHIHGGAGSNVVVASSTGIDLAQLPALISALGTGTNFEAQVNALQAQGDATILNPAIDMVGRTYTNMVLAGMMLIDMAKTNIAAEASNLVQQAQALSVVASNCANLAVCKFADSSLTNGYRYHEFTNCLFQLIDQLEAVEDTLSTTDESGGPDPAAGSGEDVAEGISNQLESLIDAFELGSEDYELGMDSIFDSGADAFNAKVETDVEQPGENLGDVLGPQFEAMAEQFATLAEQLLELQADALEAESDSMTTSATALESAAENLATQVAGLEQQLETFTTLADPLPPAMLLAAIGPTGTNAGCDTNINANNPFVFTIGGVIIGTPLNDIINAHPAAFLILGLGGDDLIWGNTNFNIIFGGKGNDEIHALGGIDLLFGGKDNDCMFGDEKFDVLFGGDGNDNLHGGTNIDLVIGWKGNDKLFGDENIDLMLGWDDDDEMDGGDGIDLMFGNKGNDTMSGGGGYKITNNIPFICKFEIGNLMFGGPGDDTMMGGEGLDVMFGLDGADMMYSSNQVDIVFGNKGDDTILGDDGGALFYIIPTPGVTNGIRLGNLIFGGPGNDTIEGGNDIDVLFGGTEDDDIRGSYFYDALLDYPNFCFDCGIADISFDIDLIFGRDGNDKVDGGHDTDILFGGKGDDLILGNGETNKIAFPEIGLLFGGPGNDTIYCGTNDILSLAFGRGEKDFIQGSSLGVMNLLFGGQDDDTIEGYGDIITLAFGGPDNDTVNGGGFVIDLLFGGPGNDLMHGKIGVLDLMFGNSGDDDMNGGISVLKLMFGNRDNDTMRSGFGALGIMFGNRGCDTMYNQALVGLDFGNREEDSLYGGISLVEIMFGNADNDYVEGGGLLDVLFGNSGDDTMQAGPVISLVFGNSGNDTLRGSSVLDLLFGNGGSDVIYGNGGPDIIFGGADKDRINGGTWPDLIFGGAGNDLILGDDGLDLLFGGRDGDFIYGGSDTDLIFGGAGSATDVIDGGPWKDIIFGQKGTDYLDGGPDKDRIWGGQDGDYLIARGDDTRLRGNKGDDQFWINGGNNVRVYGGPGTDTYSVASGSVSLSTSASSGTVSFTTPTPHCAEIHGTKWLDYNGNGVRDPGEPGLAGITITLNGGSAGTTVTMNDDPNTKRDETGMYWFTGLAAGTYLVQEVVPPGSEQTFPANNAGHSVGLGVMDIVTGRDFGNRPCVVAPSGLVMWFPLEDAPNAIWAQNRAGGLNGRYGGFPSVTSGYVDASRCFNGQNQSITVLSHGLIEVGVKDFSLDAWVRRGSAATNTQVIFDKRLTNNLGTFGYSLFLRGGRLWARLADGVVSEYDSGLMVPADGQWHFIALTVQRASATGGRFYVNNATAMFNPTARNGSLAHGRPLVVASSSLGNSELFTGCLDELEMFNRALASSEILGIYNAKSAGKCKLRCTLPAVANFCGNAATVTVNVEICNFGPTTDTFNYSFAGMPAGSGCDVAGPTGFSPASGSVVLASGACTNFPVVITRPVGLLGAGPTTLVACYRMTVQGAESRRTAVCEGKLSRPANGLCLKVPPGTPAISHVYITPNGRAVNQATGKAVEVPVTFQNEGAAAMAFDARFSVAINDGATEPAFTQRIQLAPGEESSVPLRADFGEEDDPAATFMIIIEADLDGDGEWEPLSSVGVRERVQSELAVERTGPIAGLAVPHKTISWSSIGVLEESSNALGPWVPVPGNPGSPHTVTNRLEAIRLFRLRQ